MFEFLYNTSFYVLGLLKIQFYPLRFFEDPTTVHRRNLVSQTLLLLRHDTPRKETEVSLGYFPRLLVAEKSRETSGTIYRTGRSVGVTRVIGDLTGSGVRVTLGNRSSLGSLPRVPGLFQKSP